MGNSEYKTVQAKIIEEVGAALFELRDALMELSLSLKDWQFETDLEQRKSIEKTVQQLLQQITSGKGSPL